MFFKGVIWTTVKGETPKAWFRNSIFKNGIRENVTHVTPTSSV